MGQTYKATGINLKAVPLGETDRLLTILTADYGLIRAVAPGSRKHLSRLGGRSDLFVVNDCLIVKGKSLDKLVQAETVRTFAGLSQHLGRLTASQYLAELVLFQALSDTPQPDLFVLLLEHLERLETSPESAILACLSHGIYHLLALAGVAPAVQSCCATQTTIIPNLSSPDWQVGFSPVAGGLLELSAIATVAQSSDAPWPSTTEAGRRPSPRWRVATSSSPAGFVAQMAEITYLSALEVALLQQLSRPELVATAQLSQTGFTGAGQPPHELWSRIERLLRQYAQYHFERPIRSATLIDACFQAVQ